MSFIEFVIVTIGGLIRKNTNKDYLFTEEHGFYFYIVALGCFVFYTLFPFLMPDITLPHGMGIRSKPGYSYLGELTELQRIRIKNISNSKKDKNSNSVDHDHEVAQFWDELFGEENVKTLDEYILENEIKYNLHYTGSLVTFLKKHNYTVENLKLLEKQDIDDQISQIFCKSAQNGSTENVANKFGSELVSALVPDRIRINYYTRAVSIEDFHKNV